MGRVNANMNNYPPRHSDANRKSTCAKYASKLTSKVAVYNVVEPVLADRPEALLGGAIHRRFVPAVQSPDNGVECWNFE